MASELKCHHMLLHRAEGLETVITLSPPKLVLEPFMVCSDCGAIVYILKDEHGEIVKAKNSETES